LALTPKEAAASLGIGTRLLWEKTACGEIPCARIGRLVRYPIALLEKYRADHSEGGQQR
jgi:excisionase family DNA binding protein